MNHIASIESESTTKLIDVLKEILLEKKKNEEDEDNLWSIKCSEFAKHTVNPIRRLVQSLNIKNNPDKPVISLSVGDPTILSDLEKPDILNDIVLECLKNKQNDGYTPSFGTDKARQAIAKYSSRPPTVNYKLHVWDHF
jgi:hypothetical protein